MECSFFIWMHRNSKEWVTNTSDNILSVIPSPQSTLPQNESHHSHGNIPQKNDLKSSRKGTVKTSPPQKHAGIFNKGNTCYINSILQALSVIPYLWNQPTSQPITISPLLKYLTSNLSLLGKRKSPIDPSDFLRAFQKKVTQRRGSPFNINTHQDVPQIFQILLDELKDASPIADEIISSSVIRSTTCDNCFSSSLREEKHDIISLPLCESLHSSLDTFLKPEELRGNNKWFCNVCSALQDSVRECKFVKFGRAIIFQLNRFINQGQRVYKDDRYVSCPVLDIPVHTDDHRFVSKKFKLKGT